MVTGNFTSSSKVSARAKGKSRTAPAEPGTKFAEALALLPDFVEAVLKLASDLRDKPDFDYTRVCALLAGFKPIMETGQHLILEGDLERHADQVASLLYMLDETISAGDWDAPMFRNAGQGIDRLYGLMAGYRHLDAPPIASPAASSHAGEASYRDVVESVECELSYIRTMAELMRDDSDGYINDPMKIEAVAHAICAMCGNVSAQLKQAETAGEGAGHG